MKDAQRDSNPKNPKDDPLQRIAVLERRVAVLTRENERLETFLAVLRHRIFGRSSEKMNPGQLSLLDRQHLRRPIRARRPLRRGDEPTAPAQSRRPASFARQSAAGDPRDPARQHAVPVLQPGDGPDRSGREQRSPTSCRPMPRFTSLSGPSLPAR